MKIKLKRKYTESRSNSGGKSGTSNSSSKQPTLQKLLMKTERAITFHYEMCAIKGLWEQIPVGKRKQYQKFRKDYLEKKEYKLNG